MKKILLTAAVALMIPQTAVFAADDINIRYNGELLESEQQAVVINDRTLVPVRVVCEAMGLDVSWNEEDQTVRICDELNLVTLKIGETKIDINDVEEELDAAPEIINGATCVPLRAVVEPFGADVGWDGKSRTVIVTDENYVQDETVTEEMLEQSEQTDSVISSGEESGIYFYSQPDPEWGFESNGRGYCWVCSYAMLLSNLTGTRIIPVEIAAYNLNAGGSSGNYMASHFGLAEKYGAEFIPALDENSAYFESFDTSRRGATYIKAQTDEEVTLALIEALDRNPKGVMVRFEGYPHTMVAVGYKDGVVYFNDPAGLELENVPFEETCLARSFSLSDISFIQALRLK